MTGSRKGSVNTVATIANTKGSILTVTHETTPLNVEGEEDYEDEDEDGSGENSPEDEIGQDTAAGDGDEQG